MISLSYRSDQGDVLAFSWQVEGPDAIDGMIESKRGDVTLSFGPTTAVAHWPAWQRAIAHFGENGGEARICLDPHFKSERDMESFWALDMRGAQARAAFASFLHDLADAIYSEFSCPSDEQRQAAATCRGMALAMTVDGQWITPEPALWTEHFWPSAIGILVDDRNDDPTCQHVRLTYLLPRMDGWLHAGCSMRLFKTNHDFGIEFRALEQDHLPDAFRPACKEDGLGPLLRYTINRKDGSVTFNGEREAVEALRFAHAVIRQLAHDLTVDKSTLHQLGFDGGAWQHWIAALPDLVASYTPLSLDMASDQ
jgi:hypothetical protein